MGVPGPGLEAVGAAGGGGEEEDAEQRRGPLRRPRHRRVQRRRRRGSADLGVGRTMRGAVVGGCDGIGDFFFLFS
jgi:hypothetical protein